MYQENNVEIDKATAGMLCSAIISDTLLFRSPTCTPMDKMAATELAKIAEIDMDRYSGDVLSRKQPGEKSNDEESSIRISSCSTPAKPAYGVGPDQLPECR